MRAAAVILALGLLGCTPASSGPVEVLLRTNGWRWVRDREADFHVEIRLADGRRQGVVIRQKSFATERGRMREIVSNAQLFEGPLRAGLLQHLLESSADSEVWGHWGLIRDPQGERFLLVYMIKVSEHAGQSLLRQAVLEAAHVADRWERLSTGLDQF